MAAQEPAGARDTSPPPLLPRAEHAPREALEAPLAALATQGVSSVAAQAMGTVRRAVERGAPRQGRATLRVTVDEDGTVSSVVASGGDWEGVARAIQAALAGRRLRVPAGAHGVVISFAASATVTRVPAVLTGEARATPMLSGIPAGWRRRRTTRTAGCTRLRRTWR